MNYKENCHLFEIRGKRGFLYYKDKRNYVPYSIGICKFCEDKLISTNYQKQKGKDLFCNPSCHVKWQNLDPSFRKNSSKRGKNLFKKLNKDSGFQLKRLEGLKRYSMERKEARYKNGCIICTGCKKELPENHFHLSRGKKRHKCKKCRNEYQKEYLRKNPELRRNQKYKKRYGITLEEYNVILESQKHKCKICGVTEPGRGLKHLFVDHDHELNRVRGLLCDNCNKGLGHFFDNTELLKKAIDYLGE